jgi:single-strand DNA-binding protein
MNDLNSCLVEGNLVKDPVLRKTPKGTAICSFSIASNRFFKGPTEIEKEVSFFDIEAWGNLAENCSNLGHKGRGVRILGRFKQERWETSDGSHRSKIVIIAEHIEWRPEKKTDTRNGEVRFDTGAEKDNQEARG